MWKVFALAWGCHASASLFQKSVSSTIAKVYLATVGELRV
jgi:hypothetical protein